MNEDLIKVVDWAHSIGLDVREKQEDFDFEPFLENIWIKDGIAYFNELTHPGDLLHDLGHIAVTPKALRHFLTGDLNLYDSVKGTKELERLVLTARFSLHGDEQAAIAWSFAAAQAIGIDDFLPFENGFDADEDDNDEIDSGKSSHSDLQKSCGAALPLHPGVSRLFYAKMLTHKSDFPKLNKWIQE